MTDTSSADAAWAFWSLPIGGALVSLLFTYPLQCEKDPIGRKMLGESGFMLPSEDCTNALGFTATQLSEGAAGFIALVIGGVFYVALRVIDG